MSNQTVMDERSTLIELRNVGKFYRKGQEVVKALDGIDLTVAEKGMVAVVGPSGSGKSSLLHVIGAMDLPTAGEVIVVTHAEALAQLADRIVHISDGKLASENHPGTSTDKPLDQERSTPYV